MPVPPISPFSSNPSLAHFTLSKHHYLAAHPSATFTAIATSALVIAKSGSPSPRILLLQRAAGDSKPGKWEAPGGACDDEDESIIHGAVRELWEEAGLRATAIDALVGKPRCWTLRDGREVCQFSFAVQVANVDGELPGVRLDPDEHQAFVWATRDEVEPGQAGGFQLDFTADEVRETVLLALQRSEVLHPEPE